MIIVPGHVVRSKMSQCMVVPLSQLGDAILDVKQGRQMACFFTQRVWDHVKANPPAEGEKTAKEMFNINDIAVYICETQDQTVAAIGEFMNFRRCNDPALIRVEEF